MAITGTTGGEKVNQQPFVDYNLDELVNYLDLKYRYQNGREAHAIHKLIEFYRENKNRVNELKYKKNSDILSRAERYRIGMVNHGREFNEEFQEMCKMNENIVGEPNDDLRIKNNADEFFDKWKIPRKK